MKKLLSAAVIICLLAQSGACLAEDAAADNHTVATEAPADVSMPTPTQVPAAEPSVPEQPGSDATQTPTTTETPKATDGEATRTPDPDGSTTPDPTDDPNASAVPDNTEQPDPSDSASPDSTLTPVPTDNGEIPADAEAWMEGADGVVYGKLSEMIEQAGEKATIYLRADKPMYVENAPMKCVYSLKLLPDEKIFKDGKYRVVCAETSPLDAEEVEELDLETFKDAQDDVKLNIYVWVEKVEEKPPVNPDDPAEEAKLTVEAEDYFADEWSAKTPVFTLSGIPEDKAWSYAMIVYGERIALLPEPVYSATEEGVYTIRFVILDEVGDIVDASEDYKLKLDHTLPEVTVTVDEATGLTLSIDAADAVSGVDAVSLDGGETWTEMKDGEPFMYTAPGAMTLDAEKVQVRDVAGNVWLSPESYVLQPINMGGDDFGGGGGGGGGGGSGNPPKQHAKGDGQESGEYDALELKLPEEPMHVLTIDGEELPLTLELNRSEGFEMPADYQPEFTAELAAWTEDEPEEGEEPAGDKEPVKDTLILSAVEEMNLGNRFEYRWKFNGEVCRLLANSGIRYVALEIGEDMAVFPTEGFTGGTKYTEMKMLGVSTRKFDYTISMTFDLDPDRIPMLSECDYSKNCDLAIQTEVESMKYTLSAEQKGEMYYYDVFVGPKEMMDAPYGAFGSVDAQHE